MKTFTALFLSLCLAGCAAHSSAPVTTPVDPMIQIRQDATTAVKALNAVSLTSVTALTVAKSLPNVSPQTLITMQNGVRAYNCALLNEGDPTMMPSVAGQPDETVTDACHAHNTPMLGIIAKLTAVGSADTLNALKLQAIILATQAFASFAGNAALASYVVNANSTLQPITPGVN